MLLYGLAVLPIARKLKSPEKWAQNFYADDTACLASLLRLREWLETLIKEGPKYGYFPEPHKKFLGVHPDYLEEAQENF